MSRSARETLPDVVSWSGVLPGCPGLVGRPSLISCSGREAFPYIKEWSGGPPGCPGVV